MLWKWVSEVPALLCTEVKKFLRSIAMTRSESTVDGNYCQVAMLTEATVFHRCVFHRSWRSIHSLTIQLLKLSKIFPNPTPPSKYLQRFGMTGPSWHAHRPPVIPKRNGTTGSAKVREVQGIHCDVRNDAKPHPLRRFTSFCSIISTTASAFASSSCA